MSVLVKNMEMPISCNKCDFIRHTDMYCKRLRKYVDRDDCCRERDGECPIYKLPDNHGDLIDRDDAYDCIAEQEDGNYLDMNAVGKGLVCTPVIIEAESERREIETAEWLRGGCSFISPDSVYCSRCRWAWSKKDELDFFTYCPNCGRKIIHRGKWKECGKK